MAQVGNKANSALNGEWAKHVRGKQKRLTARMRRQASKKVIANEVKEL